MLTSLAFQNFKSWETLPEMTLAPITGLFGANSSGKTSILQLLLMLKQTAASPDRKQVLDLGDERSLVSLGTFRDLVFGHDTDRKLSWSLSWQLPEALTVQDPETQVPLFSDTRLSFEACVAQHGSGELYVEEMAYRFAGHKFAMMPGEKGGTYNLETDPAFQPKRPRGRPVTMPPPTKCYGFPDAVRAYYLNMEFLADFELEFERLFNSIYYLGPLRDSPKREYRWAGAQPTDVGPRGEHAVEALLAARDRGSKISPARRRKGIAIDTYIARRLQNMGLIHSFTVQPIAEGSNLYQVRVQTDASGTQVLLTDVGFGVSQVLPALVLCYYVPKGSIVILEQPEIHLHPAVQADLADLFIDAVKARQIQIIIESHSEHLLLRLQRRIAEGKLNSNQVSLYFCDFQSGASRLMPLKLDLFGGIENWPDRFFGDTFEETVARTKAVMRRQNREVA